MIFHFNSRSYPIRPTITSPLNCALKVPVDPHSRDVALAALVQVGPPLLVPVDRGSE